MLANYISRVLRNKLFPLVRLAMSLCRNTSYKSNC